MISRVADHCLWFGRYLDRAESTVRLLESTRMMVFDAGIPVTDCWQPLVIVSGVYPLFAKVHGPEAAGDGETVQRYMMWSAENFVSVIQSVAAARENARVVRETLSQEVWEEVNSLYHWTRSDAARELYEEDREACYAYIRRSVQLCLGLVRSTMRHDEPMNFMWLGVMIERVGQIARILDMHHHTMERERELERAHSQTQQGGSLSAARETFVAAKDPAAIAATKDTAGLPVDPVAKPPRRGRKPGDRGFHPIVEEAVWLALLRSCSGFDAFRKMHRGRVTVDAMVSFLIFDEGFPRSLMYGLRASRKILKSIWPLMPGAAQGETASSYAVLDSLVAWLDSHRDAMYSQSIHDVLTRVVDDTAEAMKRLSEEIREGHATRISLGAARQS